VTLTLTSLLTWQAGLVGLCLGILAGRATQTLWYPVLVRSCLGNVPELSLRWLARPLLLLTIIFMGAAYLGQRLVVESWPVWAAGVAITLGLVVMLMLAAGLPLDLRNVVLSRMLEIAGRVGRPGPRAGA
jgi:hypothetical protein